MLLQIEYQNGEKRCELEIDLNETVEFMRFQLLSLTNVLPQDQHLLGLPAGVLVTDHMLLRQLGLKEGQRIIVTQRLKAPTAAETAATAPTSAAAAPVARSSAPAAAAAPSVPQPQSSRDESWGASRQARDQVALSMQSCCSRSFFSTEAIIQPSAMVGDLPICYTCAQTCHDPRNLKPRLSSAPMVCRCSELPSPNERVCVFAERSTRAADLLHGAVANEARAALEQIARQVVDAQLARGQSSMQARINAHIRSVMEYEDPTWQAKAREVIPLATLQERAAEAISSGSSTCGPRDELMNQLLNWFKHEFFKWVNAPACSTCQQGTTNIGGTHPNAAEAPFRPGVVELYRCPAGHTTRFPRYNHAAKLLETRSGRCGEWAQAFTLCCRALGYEARAVNDWTDHVWTEYYSEESRRWIHADSCEARRDAALLYEGGWGKKLNYIIACSKDEVVDITKRYTKKWSEVQERRILCPESWLQTYLISLAQIKLAMLPSDRQAVLLARRLVESAELAANVAEEVSNKAAAAEAALKEEEKQGRTTGSVEWREQRGELGADDLARQRALNPDSASASSSSASAPACMPAEKALCSTDPLPGATTQLASLALNSSSPTPPVASAAISTSSATVTPVDDAAAKLAQAKARTAALFRSYLGQLGTGCGVASCSTDRCKSNASFVPPPVATDLAKLALEMTKTGAAQLCPRLTTTAATAPSPAK